MPQDPLDNFINTWANSAASERANYQLFLTGLCQLLDLPLPDPATADPNEDTYTFERPVTFHHADNTTTTGFIDLYRRAAFVLETKQGVTREDTPAPLSEAEKQKRAKQKKGHGIRGTTTWDTALQKARAQAENYARALPAAEGRPPFIVVVDVGHCIELYSEFSRSGGTYVPFPDPRTHRILLQDLKREDIRTRLRTLWRDPMDLDPSRRAAKVTREIADALAKLAKSLETSASGILPEIPSPRASGILPEIPSPRASGILPEISSPPTSRVPPVTEANLRQDAGATGETNLRQDAGGTGRNLSPAHTPKTVAEFLMRCLFTMFAEDVKLLPKDAFTQLLQKVAQRPEHFKPAMEDLWRVMNTGGFYAGFMEPVLRFNGKLFANATALPLNKDQLQFLAEAAAKDWSDVEPAIFGTLLERALSPEERHKLGAHYTPRAYVERLVLPTIIEPLRDEWQAVQAAAYALAAQGNDKDARKEIHAFHRRLCTLRVLDPACGSGNFLYVTLEHLKRLEGELFNTLHDLGESQTLIEAEGFTVDPHQLLGIEINPRAAVIAELVLWIGYLQWHYRTHGDINPPEPVIKNFKNIENRDAVLNYDKKEITLDPNTLKPLTRWDGHTTKTHPITGEQVPDDTARIPVYKYTNPRPATWPEADYIIGNPPFIGTARMRDALGDGYTECIRATIKEVPESSDYVMYWWNHAAHLARKGKIKRFGFITTNSIRQTFNRRVLEHHMNADDPVSLLFAIPDHPWVDSSDGAAVRIAITVARRDSDIGFLNEVISESEAEGDHVKVLLKSSSGRISADLSIGANTNSASPLVANANLSGRGVQLIGAGFLLNPEEANSLGLRNYPGVERIIKPFVSGRDIVQVCRPLYVIDLFGKSIEEVQKDFPQIYQWIYHRVKPERDQNNRASYRNNWWVFGEPRAALRPALRGLKRFMVTVETAKFGVFTFLDETILPDNRLVAVASDDAFVLGVLSSTCHNKWALKLGGTLEDRPIYNKTRCFETFPFPAATEAQKARIRGLGERLDAHRKARQAAHPTLTMTGMYNVLEKLRTYDRTAPRASSRASSRASGILPEISSASESPARRASGILPEISSSPSSIQDQENLRQDAGATGGENLRQDAGGTVSTKLDAFPAPFDVRAAVDKRHGAFLPHWTQEGVAYAVTFRLADSLPREVAVQWYAERRKLQERAQSAEGAEKNRLQQRADNLFTEKMDTLLDNGYGACHLNNPAAAKIVAGALEFFNDTRYRLWAYCVMPNHVHAVVEPLPGHELSDILSSWKSFTAKAINKILGRTGEFWQKESFDHAIRNQQSFDNAIQYTLDNPTNAGLIEWPWIWHRASGILPEISPSPSSSSSPSSSIPNQENLRQDAGGTVEPLTPKEREIHDQGLVSVLKELHDALDTAVFDAYGWPHTLSDEEILERLVALNAERAAEERRGHIRYLRPEFQDTGRATQSEIEADVSPAKKSKAAKATWPKTLPAQVQAVRTGLRQNSPATPAEIAQLFKGANVARVGEILDALVALGQCSEADGDRYHASA